MSGSKPTSFNIREALSLAAEDGELRELVFDDDLALHEYIPKEWEEHLVWATQLPCIVDRRDYIGCCARMLVTLGSDWDGLPALLAELVSANHPAMVYDIVSSYARQRNYDVAPVLMEAIVEKFHSATTLTKAILWLDGPTRTLVKRCVSADIQSNRN